ncbi:MAG: nucleotidyltransferase domain-containing protein [Peptococcaceae bacterium]|nr:MAG: nucleotidyltransferase domain-containing protein [Peptococcaceae bacterium]
MKKSFLNAAVEKKKIKDILKRELSRRREIVFAYLHGSFLLPVPCADVDIAVYLDEAVLSPRHWEYEAKLAVSLEPLVGMSVDVLTLNCASVALRYHATCGKVLVSKNEPARFAFLEKTWREYFDCQPLFKAYLNDLLDARNIQGKAY